MLLKQTHNIINTYNNNIKKCKKIDHLEVDGNIEEENRAA